MPLLVETPRKPARISASRLRRTLLILGVCWLALSTAWIARRWWAVRILQDPANAGKILLGWEMPSWFSSHPEFAQLGRLWPTSHVNELQVFDAPADAQKLAWAIRVCGSLQQISLRFLQSPADSHALLHTLGPQPSLRLLTLDEVAMENDEILLQFLQRSPHLRSLLLRNVNFSGAHFPTLLDLDEVAIIATPFSDAGLAAILHCPVLRQLTLVDTSTTGFGLRQVPRWKQDALKNFHIEGTILSYEEREELQAMAQTIFPDGGMTIH
jgi:hypothetical protein